MIGERVQAGNAVDAEEAEKRLGLNGLGGEVCAARRCTDELPFGHCTPIVVAFPFSAHSLVK